MKTILLLAANPKKTESLRLQNEEREIRERLRGKVHIHSAVAARPKDIRQALLDSNPQIVHFSGHGAGEKGLVFEDDYGNPKLIDAEALAELFGLFPDIECVVLNACYSEFQAREIVKHISYVVGMKEEIGDDAAIKFSVGFYSAIGSGKDYDFSYKLGRNAIRLEGIQEYLIPVLLKKEDSNSRDTENSDKHTNSAYTASDNSDNQSEDTDKSDLKNERGTETNKKVPGWIIAIVSFLIITGAMLLMPTPEKTYSLIVKTNPPHAKVQIVDPKMDYQPGILLKPGKYQILVSHDGFKPKKLDIEIKDNDIRNEVVLEEIRYSLTVKTEPSNAKVSIVDPKMDYQPGMLLKPGKYQILVSLDGFTPKNFAIVIKDKPFTTDEVVLEEIRYSLTVKTEPSNAKVSIVDPKMDYQPGMLLKPGKYQILVSLDGFTPKNFAIVIKDKPFTTDEVVLEEIRYAKTKPSESSNPTKNDSQPGKYNHSKKTPPSQATYDLTIKTDPPNAPCVIDIEPSPKNYQSPKGNIINGLEENTEYKIKAICKGFESIEKSVINQKEITLVLSKKPVSVTIYIDPKIVSGVKPEDGNCVIEKSSEEGKYQVTFSDKEKCYISVDDKCFNLRDSNEGEISRDVPERRISLIPKKYPCFQDNGNGTITDITNGLIWTKCIKAVSDFSEAKNYIKFRLNNGKNNGWRLPTKDEIAQLWIEDKNDNGLHIDSIFNSECSPAHRYVYIEREDWFFDFGTDDKGQRLKRYIEEEERGYVRAVLKY